MTKKPFRSQTAEYLYLSRDNARIEAKAARINRINADVVKKVRESPELERVLWDLGMVATFRALELGGALEPSDAEVDAILAERQRRQAILNRRA
jgi:hypothetical protein